MPRTAPRKSKPAPAAPTLADPVPVAAAPPKRKETFRETAESVVVALILALMIRGFEAEAFVIPTGSMAPTLYGKHKEVDCPQCGHRYAVNASDDPSAPEQVATGICENCFYEADVVDLPAFNGDRILVMKFPYDLTFLPGAGPPARWDVVVFKYPEEPEVNYIKRLVGLGGETIRVRRGDLWRRAQGEEGDFSILRKPLEHQLAMQMPVYDDAHRPAAFEPWREWRRWAPASGSWTEPEPGRFVGKSTGGDAIDWLRYRHLVPDPFQWRDALAGRQPKAPRATLIHDLYSYNTGTIRHDHRGHHHHGLEMPEPHWVGDLSVAFDLEVPQRDGRVVVELIEGGIPHRATIDLATGMATLDRNGQALGEPSATGIDAPGNYAIRFANADDRLTLWVDGRTPFGEGVRFDGDDGHDGPVGPTAADLDPVGIGLAGGPATVSGLRIDRDIYYTLKPGSADYGGLWQLLPGTAHNRDGQIAEVFDLLADPSRFAALTEAPPRDFPIAPGSFMMMGDNSPRSKDGRGWSELDRYDPEYQIGWDRSDRKSWEVPGSLLVGKAFFVYWPHGRPFGPDIRLGQNLRIPFRPYVERMKPIH